MNKRPNTRLTSFPLLVAFSMIAVAVAAAGCSATDVVATRAARSFGAISQALPAVPTAAGLSLVAPSGDAIRLAPDLSGPVDAIAELDARPFLLAGLDPARLPAAWSLVGDRLTANLNLGDGPANPATEPAGFVTAIALLARQRLGYHQALDHFGVMLDDNLMLEWAADASTNDKDWVLVLSPDFVRAAGGDPALVAGWTLAMVPVKADDGSMVDREKLLRFFNLVD